MGDRRDEDDDCRDDDAEEDGRAGSGPTVQRVRQAGKLEAPVLDRAWERPPRQEEGYCQHRSDARQFQATMRHGVCRAAGEGMGVETQTAAETPISITAVARIACLPNRRAKRVAGSWRV